MAWRPREVPGQSPAALIALLREQAEILRIHRVHSGIPIVFVIKSCWIVLY